MSGANEGCFGESFEDYTFVISTLVRVFQAREQTVGLLFTNSFAELIAEGEDQHDQRFLMIGLYPNDITANTFGLGGVIQKAITIEFLEGPGNAFRWFLVLFHHKIINFNNTILLTN